jgi:hypothetical protein
MIAVSSEGVEMKERPCLDVYLGDVRVGFISPKPRRGWYEALARNGSSIGTYRSREHAIAAVSMAVGSVIMGEIREQRRVEVLA